MAELHEDPALIQIRDLSMSQGGFRLQGVSLEIPTGRYGVLMGKTGCGKTSILEAVAGLRPVAFGNVFLNDRNITRLPPGERGIGYVPQDAALFRSMTVYKHLAFALELRGHDWTTIDDRVKELADWLGLEHLLNRKPAGLSGGESQRVALGRALSFRPKYLLLDEPLSSLDEETRGSLMDLLIGVREQRDVTILHVTHSKVEADRLADVRFQLVKGKAIQED